MRHRLQARIAGHSFAPERAEGEQACGAALARMGQAAFIGLLPPDARGGMMSMPSRGWNPLVCTSPPDLGKSRIDLAIPLGTGRPFCWRVPWHRTADLGQHPAGTAHPDRPLPASPLAGTCAFHHAVLAALRHHGVAGTVHEANSIKATSAAMHAGPSPPDWHPPFPAAWMHCSSARACRLPRPIPCHHANASGRQKWGWATLASCRATRCRRSCISTGIMARPLTPPACAR